MITYKNEPVVFRPFTVSFDIDNHKDAIAFMNACATLANVSTEDVVNTHSYQESTSADLRMISDKMAVGDQWRELVKMTEP